MFSQSMLESNYLQDNCFSSSKKKTTTPALIFFKSQKDSSSKNMSQNNSALLNTNRSPMRGSNAKNTSLISRSPLMSKSNIISSQNKQTQNLLFSSKSRKIDQQSFHDTSMKDSIHFCENHEERTANYMASFDENNTEYFCEKCAILLASQGYKVEKISESSMFESRKMQVSRNLLNHSTVSQKSSKSSRLSSSRTVNESLQIRKAQIEAFLSNTKGLLQQIEQKKQEIKQNLIKSEQFYGQQIEEVNEYFELLYKSLELEKNKCYNYILNQRVEVQRPVRLINDTISELKEKLYGIIEDIEENIEIVYHTAEENYKPVIEQYADNYEEISKRIDKIEIFEVEMRKINFEGVPESIFCISDILKESIEQNFKAEQQNYLNNQLFSLKQSLRDSLPQLQPKKLFSKREQEQQIIQASNSMKNLNNSKMYFSFEGQALREQYEQEKLCYERDEWPN